MKSNDAKPGGGSAIGWHLLKKEQCALNYDRKRFSILAHSTQLFPPKSLRGSLCQDSAPGVMKTERVCFCFQTLLIIVAFLFGLLLSFL